MSDLVLFSIGSVVFFVGGLGIVLYGLDTFRAWSIRETDDDAEVEGP